MKFFAECETTDGLGGKAESLVRLIKAGFVVPDGFVVFPGDELTAEDMKKACSQLGGALYAVRSSGSLEDGADNSFAGQFDTYLNVSVAGVGQKIRDCRNSANNERLLAYTSSKAIDTSKLVVTVVVQRMVAAHSAGVVFTRNPVDGSEDLVVEAVRGLGENLVSGTTTPDTYIVSRSGELVDVFAPTEQVLSSGEISEILDVSLRIETLYGAPMDIEWAYEDTKLYILQARPVTTM
jgi:phosphoenolpyruvate synthase/pyruvate phosphate dikinase